MDLLDSFAVTSALAPVGATYLEEEMESSGLSPIFFICSTIEVIRSAVFVYFALCLIDIPLGLMKSYCSNWIIHTIGLISLFCGTGISYVFPFLERYYGNPAPDEHLLPSTEDFKAPYAEYYKEASIGMTCQVSKPYLANQKAKILFLRAAREALILPFFPSYLLVHCISLILLSALCIKKLSEESGFSEVSLKFSWKTSPKPKWHRTINNGNIEWNLNFKMNRLHEYLCPAGHKLADNPQDLMHLVEKNRKSLLDNSWVDVTRYIYTNGRSDYYGANFGLGKGAPTLCPHCKKPGGSVKIEVYGHDWRTPYWATRSINTEHQQSLGATLAKIFLGFITNPLNKSIRYMFQV